MGGSAVISDRAAAGWNINSSTHCIKCNHSIQYDIQMLNNAIISE